MPRLTKERHAEMLADYVAGMPFAEMMGKYNLHPTSISKAARRAGASMRQESRPSSDARRAKRRWQTKNPLKRKAHQAVEWALKKGNMKRETCQRCGSSNSQAHHEDYSKPLEVIWLCQPHHAERHIEMKKAADANV